MAKNEKTSKKMGTLASIALRGQQLTKKQVQRLGGGLLTQRPDKKKNRK